MPLRGNGFYRPPSAAVTVWSFISTCCLQQCAFGNPPRHFVALSRPGGKRVTGFSVVCRLPMNPVPLPPDKQGGAREYIGARHPPLKRVGKWRSGTVPFSSKTCCSLLAGSEDSDTLKLFPLRGTTACRLPLSHKQHKKLPEILCSRVAAGKFQEVFLFLFTAGC